MQHAVVSPPEWGAAPSPATLPWRCTRAIRTFLTSRRRARYNGFRDPEGTGCYADGGAPIREPDANAQPSHTHARRSASPGSVGAVSALVGLAASYPTDDGLAVAILVLAAGIVLVCLPVRLPGSLLALLPAVLIPSWLALGLLATAALAAAATLAGPDPRLPPDLGVAGGPDGRGRRRGWRPDREVAGGGRPALDSAAGACRARCELRRWKLGRRATGHRCATPAGLAGDLRGLPRMSVVANLLLAWPAAILADVLMARGLLLFGLLLAVLVAALVLIALYLGAETARWGAAGERERLQSIVSQVPDGIFTVRPDLTIDWLNETAPPDRLGDGRRGRSGQCRRGPGPQQRGCAAGSPSRVPGSSPQRASRFTRAPPSARAMATRRR